MKFGTLKDGTAIFIEDDRYIPLSKLGFNGSIKDLIISGRDAAIEIIRSRAGSELFHNLDSSLLDAPFRDPSKIVALGLNYRAHASESQMKIPTHPLIFTKFPSAITGPFDDVHVPASLTLQPDYEVELGVIIGSRTKNVSEHDALNHVFGYTTLNDVTARDIQFSEGQWVRAKSIDTFCPIGPWIVTSDEIPDPQALELKLTLNGKIMQSGQTSNMIFGVAKTITLLSQSFTLEPGDIIATGTPSGVGFARIPPIYLKDGDEMISEISCIGKMRNRIKTI